jgi:glycosyltransferase involved in cell wall biosynthesis
VALKPRSRAKAKTEAPKPVVITSHRHANRRSVTLVIPVFNEEAQIATSLLRVREALPACPDWAWDVVVADNASTDATWNIATAVCACYGMRVVRLPRKGRGGALKSVWLSSPADFLAYCDVDLSTDLAHLPHLIGPLDRCEADLVIGSRLIPGSRVRRGLRREILSRAFNRIARALTGSAIRDHQCGFKAISRAAASALLPGIANTNWFFDTELLIAAQRAGWRVREIPVRWADDPDSRVRVAATIAEHLAGVWRLRRRG